MKSGSKKKGSQGSKSSGSPKSDAVTEEERKLRELERERKLLEKENAERKRKLDKLKEEEKATMEAAEKGEISVVGGDTRENHTATRIYFMVTSCQCVHPLPNFAEMHIDGEAEDKKKVKKERKSRARKL